MRRAATERLALCAPGRCSQRARPSGSWRSRTAACDRPGGPADGRDRTLSTLWAVPHKHGAVVALSARRDPTVACHMWPELYSRSCDPHMCMHIWSQAHSIILSLKGKCQLYCLLNDAAGRPRSRRDMPRTLAVHRRCQISNNIAVPEWAHNRLQHQTSLPASPRAPRSQSARSACRPCVLRESNNATQAAPRGIPMESCQQVAGDRRHLLSEVHGIQPTGLQESRTSAAIMSRRLL